ncbi:hypothetical protein [Chitiniphilus eburneus]|uniref:Uncharacterized protein n=1 Tax=Chitiniphilus eburneus TaxID=2571148 RepID=A0A4U0QCS7_9NEIS|nr:hypothetical protein [Chitiniphilus eburneus]TJZ79116.1 hypothetical protein FAZ21_02185 [Chitiniphilus eburneus]
MAPALPRPTPSGPPQRSTLLAQRHPVATQRFTLAGDAGMQLDPHPEVSGNVTLNTIDQATPQLVERIASQIPWRWQLRNSTPTIQPDTLFPHNHQRDHPNPGRHRNARITPTGSYVEAPAVSLVAANDRLPRGTANAGLLPLRAGQRRPAPQRPAAHQASQRPGMAPDTAGRHADPRPHSSPACATDTAITRTTPRLDAPPGPETAASFDGERLPPPLVVHMPWIGGQASRPDQALTHAGEWYRQRLRESVGRMRAMSAQRSTVTPGSRLCRMMPAIPGPVLAATGAMR